ncbi:hypothetical protein D3C81_1835410 [compost metagenome]
MKTLNQSHQVWQGLRPGEPFLAGDLAQGFSWQRSVKYRRHARGLQFVVLQDLQGRHAELLQLDSIVDEAFRVGAKQRR